MNKKKAKEKIYKYIMIIKCKECGLEVEDVGPCVKCGGFDFIRVYEVKEVK